MKKLFIAVASALALFLAGATYAAQEADNAKPAQETMKQQTMKQETRHKTKKRTARKKKCTKGEVYNKKEKKCVPKA